MLNDIEENKNKKKALGRGLNSLLGGALAEENSQPTKINQIEDRQAVSTITNTAIDKKNKIWQLSIDKLVSGAFQPRDKFNKESLEELAQSIKQNGIIQPIIARENKEKGIFEIIAGERRWRAAQIAGVHEVPVIIKELENKETLEWGIIENVQREDLDPIEEGRAYQRLANEFGLSQQEIAQRVGKDRSTVTNLIRILSLPNKIHQMIQANEISLGHSKVLLSLTDLKTQLDLARKTAEEKLSVRALEKLVEQAKKSETTDKINIKPAENLEMKNLISVVAEELQKKLGTKVSIQYNHGKGSVNLYFYSDEQLNNIVDRVRGS